MSRFNKVNCLNKEQINGIKIKIAQSGKQKVCILKINAYYRVVAVKNT